MLTGAGAGGEAITNPAGKLSINPIPVSGIVPVFLIVIVSNEYCPTATGLGAKNLPTLAPARFVKVASAGSGLEAPCRVVTALLGIAFVRLPLTLIVTLKVSVHRFLAANLPPLKVKADSPEMPVKVPPHVPTEKLGGLAMTIPVGILSVKLISDKSASFGLIKSMLMVDDEPPKTVKGSKPFTNPMVRSVTRRFALVPWEGLIVVPVPKTMPLTSVAGIVLV